MSSQLPQLTTAKGDFTLGRNFTAFVDIHIARTLEEQTSELSPDVLSHSANTSTAVFWGSGFGEHLCYQGRLNTTR